MGKTTNKEVIRMHLENRISLLEGRGDTNRKIINKIKRKLRAL